MEKGLDNIRSILFDIECDINEAEQTLEELNAFVARMKIAYDLLLKEARDKFAGITNLRPESDRN